MKLLADMALFVEVANMQHFGRAAAALEMPPSSLSRRIGALEKELGVALIRRSTRHFALTEEGALCYERARKLVAEAARIREDLGPEESGARGRLRVGLPLDLAHTLFLPMFTAFQRAYPAIRLEVLSIQGHPNVLAEGLDVAWIPAHQTRLPDSGQWARRVGSFGRKLFASAFYLENRPAPREPAELAAHDCLLYAAGPLQKQWELRRGRERRTVAVKSVCAANSIGLLASFAREHRGIAMLPDFLAAHPAYGGGLIQVLPEWEGVPAHVFAVTPTRLLPARTRKLVELTKSEFAQRLAERWSGAMPQTGASRCV